MTTEEKQHQTAQPPRPATISTPDVPTEGYDANGAPVAAQEGMMAMQEVAVDFAAEAMSLRTQLSAATEQAERAERWIGVVGEELVLAGYFGGDRSVVLGNLRTCIQQRNDYESDRDRLAAELEQERQKFGDLSFQYEQQTHALLNARAELRKEQDEHHRALQAFADMARELEQVKRENERLTQAELDAEAYRKGEAAARAEAEGLRKSLTVESEQAEHLTRSVVALQAERDSLLRRLSEVEALNEELRECWHRSRTERSQVEAREAKLREALDETNGLLVAITNEPRPNDEILAQIGENRAALQRPDSAPKLRWQCSGCRWGFPGPWMKVCPACGREDYWSGSVDPKARPWPGPDSEKPAEHKHDADCFTEGRSGEMHVTCPTPKPAPDREPGCGRRFDDGSTCNGVNPICGVCADAQEFGDQPRPDSDREPGYWDTSTHRTPPRPDPSTCEHRYILSTAPRRCEMCGEREPWVQPPLSVPAPAVPKPACTACHDPAQWVDGKPHPKFENDPEWTGMKPTGTPGVCYRCDANPTSLDPEDRDDNGDCRTCKSTGLCVYCHPRPATPGGEG